MFFNFDFIQLGPGTNTSYGAEGLPETGCALRGRERLLCM